MDLSTLMQRIEAWPNQWKAAKQQALTAQENVSRLEQELAQYQATPGNSSDSEADLALLELEYQAQQAGFEADRTKAILEIQIREDAALAGTKLTESSVEAHVKADPTYSDHYYRYFKVKHDVAVAKLQKQQRVAEASLQHASGQDLKDLQNRLEDAHAEQAKALLELSYQEKRGEELRMLTDLSMRSSL